MALKAGEIMLRGPCLSAITETKQAGDSIIPSGAGVPLCGSLTDTRWALSDKRYLDGGISRC